MKFSEVGFRPFYKKFCIIPYDNGADGILKGFPNAELSNAYLAYGYMDSDAGLTLEVIAGVYRRPDGKQQVFHTAMDRKSMVRIDSVKDIDVQPIEDETGGVREIFREKIHALRMYQGTLALEEIRDMTILDSLRHPVIIDDIQVHLQKDGFDEEICWARLENYSQDCLTARLLSQPFQNLGVHAGDKIQVKLGRYPDGKIIGYTELE